MFRSKDKNKSKKNTKKKNEDDIPENTENHEGPHANQEIEIKQWGKNVGTNKKKIKSKSPKNHEETSDTENNDHKKNKKSVDSTPVSKSGNTTQRSESNRKIRDYLLKLHKPISHSAENLRKPSEKPEKKQTEPPFTEKIKRRLPSGSFVPGLTLYNLQSPPNLTDTGSQSARSNTSKTSGTSGNSATSLTSGGSGPGIHIDRESDTKYLVSKARGNKDMLIINDFKQVQSVDPHTNKTDKTEIPAYPITFLNKNRRPNLFTVFYDPANVYLDDLEETVKTETLRSQAARVINNYNWGDWSTGHINDSSSSLNILGNKNKNENPTEPSPPKAKSLKF